MSGLALGLAGAGALAFFLLNQEETKRKKIDDIKGYTHLLPGANSSGNTMPGVIDDNPSCPVGTDLNPNDGLCYPPFNPCEAYPGTVLNPEGTMCLPPAGNPNTGENADNMDAVCAEEFGEGFTYNAKDNLCLPPEGGNICAGMGLGGQDLEYWPKEEGGDGMCHYPDGQPPVCPVGHVWRKDDRGEYRCMRGHALDIGLSSQHLAVQILAETGLSFAAYSALDFAGRQAARATHAAGRAAQNAAQTAAQNAAAAAARQAAGGGMAGANAARAARDAVRAAQESQRVAQAAATAARAAQAAARTTRFTVLMATMAGTPFGLIFMIIAQILIAVLGLNPDEFENCRDGEFDVSALPDWARILIESVPFAGDLFAMIGPTLCIRTGCEAPNVEQHGLCYPPPRENFWCEAFLCYSQHPGWQNNGQLHTTTHITKNIPLDTGTIPLSCPEGSRLDGLLCYRVPEWGNGNGNPGVTILAGVAWENCRPGMTDTGVRCEDVYGGGVGQLRVVPAGWIDDGLTAREPIRGYPCPGGWIEEPLTCREPLSGGNCEPIRTYCPGNNPFLCRSTGGNCHPIRGGRVEGRRMGGGRVEGRGAGSSLPCPAGTAPAHDGLCYENCREGFRREGLLCSRSYDKRSEVLAPFSPSCPPDRIDGAGFGSAGLCYMNPLPEGYRRVVAGTIEQMCPTSPPEWGPVEENVLDIGVACQRARYSRGAGTVPFNMRVKARRHPMPPPPVPPSCDERRALLKTLDEKGQDTHQAVLCIEAPCAEDEDITGDGKICVPRCRPGFRSMNRAVAGSDEPQVVCARDATADAPAEEYVQRPNRPIDFGFL